MEESGRVLGVGVGLFIIILVWSCALAGLATLSRLAVGSAVGLCSVATVVTVCLFLVPREQITNKETEEEPELVLHDSMFIGRTVMVVLMSLSAIVGVAVVGLDYGLHVVKPHQIKKTL